MTIKDDLDYSTYLDVDHLLALQKVRSDPPEHDEMLFIVIHQVYELWFKLLIHELDKIGQDFDSSDLTGATSTWKRCCKILKVLVHQLDVLETMTPLSFKSFRDRLDTASGFQSRQFRELEFFLGYKRQGMLRFFGANSEDRRHVQRRLEEPSLVDRFRRFLEQRGLSASKTNRQNPVTSPTGPDALIQEQILRLYRADDEMVPLFELMTDFDEGLQEWRYRHYMVVLRTIGDRKGTGGSEGAGFLKESLFAPIFPDLWAIRGRM